MQNVAPLGASLVSLISRTCLCRRVQHASRKVGKRFDDAFRPLGINNWQFTLLMALARPAPPTVNRIATELGMDRTTTTKNLRPLERRGLIEIRPDQDDGRVRRIVLTDAGRGLLNDAVGHWRRVNDEIASGLNGRQLDALRSALDIIAEG